MVSATTALKANQYFWMLMFIMMTTFPEKLGDAYSMDGGEGARAPKCDSTSMKAFIFGVFSIFGIQIGFLSVLCGALSRDSVSKKAKSVTCLCVMVGLILFILRDGSRTFDAEWPADKMPKDGVYANAVIWSVLAGLCYSGWQDSGAVKPNTSALVPSGKFGLPIIVGLVNWLFYALPLTFMADKFVKEGFGREELMAGFTPAVNFLLAAIFQNIGLMCLLAIVACVCSVDKEDARTASSAARRWCSSSAWAPSRRTRSPASS